ncbi:proto-oncogene vav-like isoform X2 [Pseudochaenichthys georgianus]|uniref:proto-oncogene vav-like isoform X2 n=1 Tax=Pseudochaenichthys georgianus TaxID=52239 RepID=UPI00146AAD97|nr:proto-oncogene vav-like isoform X2 [Pseudochaenichthys georgianus]
MELWRQCAMWLIECRVLPENHRVTWEGAQVCDLAQALRDGVLLCQLLNNLMPQAVNLREINLRPQMSQFLCLKNIRMFLGVCQEKFDLKKSELFEAFDLFDVRDFAKVIDTLSILSHSPIATQKRLQPFPLGGCTPDDEIYSGLSDQIDDTVDEDDDLYDFVEDEENEGDEIYEDLMRTEEQPEIQKIGVDKRECCLLEIRQTEEKYSDTLQSILQHFMKPLQKFLQEQDMESIFINIEELADTHRTMLAEVRSSILDYGAKNLYQVFLSYKERLLLYGHYCSQVETATKTLDKLSTTREDIRMKLEECSNRANSRRFSLRDLLMVPMQRVLKYHLLLQELLKHTTDAADKENLRTALDAMRDLAQCVNEVKRDNEIIRQITTFQLSIENMTQSLALYGRPKIDGELKICSPEKKSKQDRYAFLFDKAMFICKKKSGEAFELKEIVELQHYQIRDETAGEKDNKKWSYVFLLLDSYGKCGYDLFFKTRELKKKWLEQFEMAQSNMCPDNSTANNHDFQMHCFEGTTCCKACSMLLRGIFFQGYRCTRCKMAAHKECLGRVTACGRNSDHAGTLKKHKTHRSTGQSSAGFPKMEASQEYYGVPPPPVGFGQPLQLSKGDIIELTRADAELPWWEGRNMSVGQMGWFPSQKVHPYVPRQTPDLSSTIWFAGNMDRTAAKNLLLSRSDGTFLVRQKDGGEFAISIKFNMDIRHIKITSTDGLYRINEKKAFKGIMEMIQFYQKNSLKEYFKDVDTTLLTPFKQPEQSNSSNNAQNATPNATPGGSLKCLGVVQARYNFSPRDRSELSLREGDTIKIISKKGHSGWWKGEVYGRVGYFPANYVEEECSDYC